MSMSSLRFLLRTITGCSRWFSSAERNLVVCSMLTLIFDDSASFSVKTVVFL